MLQLEVGDTAKVVLRNSLPFPVNIEPAGLVPSSTRLRSERPPVVCVCVCVFVCVYARRE